MKAKIAIELPEPIARFLGKARLIPTTVGESPCPVYRFKRGNDSFFLKMCSRVYSPTTFSVRREADVLGWLSGQLNVPEVVGVAESSEGEFMITRSVPGQPLYQRIDAQQPVLHLFQEALAQLQALPITTCPFDGGVAFRLKELEYLLANGLLAEEYDLHQWPDVEANNPQEFVAHLFATQPTEELVFAHGDLTDSNVFVDAQDRLYFIDWGRGGVADRWMDRALVYHNLLEEVSPTQADAFLAELGEADNPRKRVFYEQLDELF
ncbi:APH(3') family aminoglycoside O-phosphotransferase [Spirosoma sp. 209]|uniref:APH(3') family aminoglycoside O-phosphotransferase n=1 Tax=Spirosoma sp. 209 TaxID=1955701 RepID=UPI00098D5831|nr:APH(3') family aminoglycoside O-phosphotransferase [Spirosoma sp. 209]